jgi:heptosyltransferase I
VERLLIVLLGALGDVVRGFSVLPPLKRTYPNLHVTWLVEPRCKGIVSLHADVDEILVFERPKPLQSYSPSDIYAWGKSVTTSLKEVKQVLSERTFDVTLDLQRHFKSGALSLLSGSPRRIGFHRDNCKEFNWLFNTETTKPYNDQESKVYHYLAFLEQLGIDSSGPVEFGLTKGICPGDIPEILSADTAKRYVGLVLGSTWASKDWPLEGYEKLLHYLIESGLTPVLLGDPSQAVIAERLLGIFTGPVERIINLAGKTSLRELLGTVSVCTLCVGPDSGPGHIASALGKPYVSIFGPTAPERVAPFGQGDNVLQAAIGCSPCWRRTCPGLGTLCMRLVSAEQVFAKVSQVVGLEDVRHKQA